MWKQIKSDFQRRPKLFLGVFALLLLLLVMAVVQLLPYLPVIWPGQAQIAAEQQAVEQAHRELQARIDQSCELIRNQESLLARNREFWISARDGNVETMPQKIIEEAAVKSGVALTAVGNVQSEKLGDISQRMHLAVSAQAPFGDIVEFIAEIEKCRPRFFWRNLTMRPDNIRTYDKVVFNASLEFICLTDEETADLLMQHQP